MTEKALTAKLDTNESGREKVFPALEAEELFPNIFTWNPFFLSQ